MIALAHRGNWDGAVPARENTLEAIAHCLDRGWGLETDIRRASDGRFYISHDPVEVTDRNRAELFCETFRRYPSAPIALNIKELGYERELLDFLDEQHLTAQVILFDMELLESTPGATAALFRELSPRVRIGARVSDRGESVQQALRIAAASVIWLDEFDSLWATASVVQQLKAAGKTVYAISPEIHGFGYAAAEARWRQFRAWGVDGVCTDCADALEAMAGHSKAAKP